MKVCHITENFSLLSETFIYDLVTEVDKKNGFESRVFTIKRQNKDERPFPRVHRIGYPNKYNPERVLYRIQAGIGFRSIHNTVQPILRKRFKNALERINPDIMHAQFGTVGALVSPLVEHLKCPLVVSFHGADVTVKPQQEHIAQRYQRLFRQGTLFHTVSHHIADRVAALGAPENRIRVIHNGIRLDLFGSRKANVKGGDGVVECLHVGRLVEKKAPLHLVRAFRHAQHQLNGGELRLTIAGNGPLRSRLESEIARLDLRDSVRLLGSVSHKRVAELMFNSHIYTQHCMTASNGDQEGMGVTFAEASAVGLPIVTTNHNGIPDVVKHESTGYLVEEGDIEAMGRRIAQLASSPEKRHQMGQAGREHVHANFQLSKQADKMTSCYHEAIDLKN
jgi:glycosyltransferase involved in cell wall biosynthesis